MKPATLRFALGACRVWTAIYTRGLSPETRETRRLEIESDLWEHQAHAREIDEAAVDTGFHILTRVLLGIPADLSWRSSLAAAAREVPYKGDRTMVNKLFVALATVLTVAFGILFLYMGVGRGIEEAAAPALWPLGAGLALVSGVVAANWSVRIGSTLVAAGAVAIITMMPWMIAITLPLSLVSVAGTMMRPANHGRQHRLGA